MTTTPTSTTATTDHLKLILASSSPRRQMLLRDAGFEFEVDPADIDEENYPPEILPAELALRLARAKAMKVATRHPEDVVLAADTVVALGDQVLGKPRDAAHAGRMLRLLSGTTHIVITGVAVRHILENFAQERRVMSAVRMNLLSDNQIERYVATNDWQGKAGGYGIQDNDPFVTRLSGSLTNIVGLPMEATKQMLAAAGVVPRSSS